MKSNSPESALFRDVGMPDRNRRSLTEATSQLGHAVGEALTGALGGRRHGGGRSSSESSAATSTHRLREVLERDRALVAAQQTAAEEASARVQQSESQAHARRSAQPHQSEGSEVRARIDTSKSGAPTQTREPPRAREQRGRAPVRVPPPPLPSRKPAGGGRSVEDRALVDALVGDDHDDDDAISVHDEPTRVGPPPALQVEDRHGSHRSASAAAAASAFGSSSSPVSPSAPPVVTPAQPLDMRAAEAPPKASKAGASKAAKSKPPATKASADTQASPSRTRSAAPASVQAPRADAEEDTSLLPREPIRTLTMARLLASQGHLRRALSIYDELLIKTPSDLGLRTEAETLRALQE